MVLYDVFIVPFKKSNVAFYPSVAVVIAGHNEEDVIWTTMDSLYGTYPFIEMVVVDDGSTDRTYDIAKEFAKLHSDVQVFKRDIRGGKGSAVNIGIQHTASDIILMVDSDSHFGPNAIFNMVQPFRDSKVGAVSGAIHARNGLFSIASWLQAFEYLSTIQVGRIFSSRIGTLSIASGAFAAFRRDAAIRGFGMDVSVAEDLDLCLRLRKAGWKIVFTPRPECYTNVPETFKSLYNQRLRWDRGYIRYEVIKHNSIGSIFWNNFRLSSFIYFYEQILFNIVLTIAFWLTTVYLLFSISFPVLWKIMALITSFYMVFSFFQLLVVLFYSNNWKRDIPICAAFPLMFFYSVFLKTARIHAFIQEVFFKKSYSDRYVPSYIQKEIRRTFNKF
jgi:cellulose synthase/poly-beta-1,6-N-acetylglucosamine synthase-like glycosyltransferase